MLNIAPYSGLCNRLRVVFSWNQYALKTNQRLRVVWNRSAECPGLFSTYFEPVKNIIFKKTNDNHPIDYAGVDPHPDYRPANTPSMYDALKLKPILQERLKTTLGLLRESYNAVHIRRTDFMPPETLHMGDEEFETFIESNGSELLYIATDNRETQDKFMKKYSGLIRIINLIDTTRVGLRKTSLKDAIVDLYVCVHANKFLGSKWSSFSELIWDLRGDPRLGYGL
jgi:hypothetical protein